MNRQLKIIEMRDDGYQNSPASFWPHDWAPEDDTSNETFSDLLATWLDWVREDNVWEIVEEGWGPGGHYFVTLRRERGLPIHPDGPWQTVEYTVWPVIQDEDVPYEDTTWDEEEDA